MDPEELKKKIEEAFESLKKEKERKFNETVDLIINLQKFDPKKTSVNTVLTLPYKVKDKKIAGFLEAKNKKLDTITLEEFRKYNTKSELKLLVKKYDFFIAQSSLMPKVASTFGKVLGPSGKMPSPQLGIIINADDKIIDELKNKINNSVKLRIKESSVKFSIGKRDSDKNQISENAVYIYNALLKILPKGKENVKNVAIKFTMTKPIKIYLK